MSLAACDTLRHQRLRPARGPLPSGDFVDPPSSWVRLLRELNVHTGLVALAGGGDPIDPHIQLLLVTHQLLLVTNQLLLTNQPLLPTNQLLLVTNQLKIWVDAAPAA